jgi:hypothetical protein
MGLWCRMNKIEMPIFRTTTGGSLFANYQPNEKWDPRVQYIHPPNARHLWTHFAWHEFAVQTEIYILKLILVNGTEFCY